MKLQNVLVTMLVGLAGLSFGSVALASSFGNTLSNALVELANSELFIDAVNTRVSDGDLTKQEGDKLIAEQLANEAREISLIRQEFEVQVRASQQTNGFPLVVGEVALADSTPTSFLDFGETGLLTFQFIDPVTGFIAPGPAIEFVTYEFIPDSSIPDMTVVLGTSFDVTTNFGLNFTLSDFEELVIGTPFDNLGNPIFIEGAEGPDDNVAPGFVVAFQNIPEPPISFHRWFSLFYQHEGKLQSLVRRITA